MTKMTEFALKDLAINPKISPDEVSLIKTRLQAILFSIEEGIVMLDFAGDIQIINDAAKTMLGIQKKFPYEQKFLDYVADAEIRGKLDFMLESPIENVIQELTLTKGEKNICVRAAKSVVTTAKGETLGKVLVFRDVTREKELESLKEDFVHSITHDLKSPLTSIQGYLDLFMSDEIEPLSAEQKRHMEIMSHSTRKLLKLVSNILDMAKIEAGQLKIQRKPWDVVQGVYQVLNALHAVSWLIKINMTAAVSFTKDGIKTTMQIYPSVPGQTLPEMILSADGSLLDRAISNLVDNAIKHTPQGGTIEVHVEDEPDKVRVSVCDNGGGIPEEALEKIFQKFQQLSGTKGGTGLGLTFTRETVERHGGRISVTSQLKKGANFTFWIPK